MGLQGFKQDLRGRRMPGDTWTKVGSLYRRSLMEAIINNHHKRALLLHCRDQPSSVPERLQVLWLLTKTPYGAKCGRKQTHKQHRLVVARQGRFRERNGLELGASG